MAEITLRSYSQEVDGLIELEQLDEAIAHCRQILQAFPKHLDTYRLLGKAYLEAKRYGDASDIFQRVLSSEPADFVSHIGMSVIREDEGNLDSAIWHMERAFENNPANQVIQQELKRLFGQRDGSEPTKVRLTRGALARMYANGELYPQAVAELRAALDEDPERTDLQVLLAEMYWQMNQQLEAAEICNKVMEKLPHCREANRIMAAVLQASGKSDAAGVYLRRLAAIDPYTAFLESQADDPALVDEESVTLEKLAWQAGDELAEFVRSKPDWATSLGSDLSTDEEAPEDSLQWSELVASLPTEDESPGDIPETSRFVDSLSEEDEAIPDWLREGGWNEASGEATEERVSFSDDELAMLEAGIPPDGDLARADIPDWLKDLAPVGITDADMPSPPESAPEPGETALPEWLQGIAEEVRKDEDEAVTTPPFEEEQPEEEDEEEEITSPEEPEESEYEDRRQLPTWLEDSEPGGAETILTWLGSRTQTEPSEDRVREELSVNQQPEEADTNSWLRGVAEAAAQKQPADEVPGSTLPEDVLRGDQFDPTKAVTRELSPDMLDLFGKSPATEEIEDQEPSEPARWEPEFESDDIAEPEPPPAPSMDEAIDGTLAGKGIEWLDTLAGVKRPEPVKEEPEVPTWLRELASDTGELEAEESISIRDEPGIEEPDSLSVEIPAEFDEYEPGSEPEPAAPESQPVLDRLEHVPPFIDEASEPEDSEAVRGKTDEAAEIPAAREKPATPARPPSVQKPTAEQAAARLDIARRALEIGDVQSAAHEYQALIRAKIQLTEVINELQRALERYPDTPILWQVLGDAHMKADRLADAMDAYRQGLDTI